MKSIGYWIWEFVKEPGGLLVLIGVAGELIFEYTQWVKDKNRSDRLKRTFGLVLVLGLVLEIPESARIRERAGKANERAANLEATNVLMLTHIETLRSNNLVLETNLLTLRLKLQPRAITPAQVTNFVFLTEKITKIPVTVSVGKEGSDTDIFAFHLRQMFSKAGFGVKNGATELGIKRDPSQGFVRNIGIPPYGADVILVLPSQEEFEKFGSRQVLLQATNGFMRPIVNTGNEPDVYSAINRVFQQMGIRVAFWASQWPTKEFEVFVPVREQF